jgi:hypothetical protein
VRHAIHRKIIGPPETLRTFGALSCVVLAAGLAVLVVFSLLLSTFQKPPAIGR